MSRSKPGYLPVSLTIKLAFSRNLVSACLAKDPATRIHLTVSVCCMNHINTSFTGNCVSSMDDQKRAFEMTLEENKYTVSV